MESSDIFSTSVLRKVSCGFHWCLSWKFGWRRFYLKLSVAIKGTKVSRTYCTIRCWSGAFLAVDFPTHFAFLLKCTHIIQWRSGYIYMKKNIQKTLRTPVPYMLSKYEKKKNTSRLTNEKSQLLSIEFGSTNFIVIRVHNTRHYGWLNILRSGI